MQLYIPNVSLVAGKSDATVVAVIQEVLGFLIACSAQEVVSPAQLESVGPCRFNEGFERRSMLPSKCWRMGLC
jgi:hypothetical protein